MSSSAPSVSEHLNINFKSRIGIAELPELFSSMLQEYSTQLIDKIVMGQEFLSDKFDDIICQLQKLKVELKTLKAENDYLKQSLKALGEKTNSVSTAVCRQEVQIDTRLRSEISTNAVLLGVPKIANENSLDLVSNICKTIGVDLDKNRIVSCERIPTTQEGNNPIRVTFKDKHDKEDILLAKKKFGRLTASMIQGIRWQSGWSQTIIIRDELSPLSMELFRTLKKHQATLNIRYVWPGRNGIIFAKHSQCSKPILIKSREDLNKLLGGM